MRDINEFQEETYFCKPTCEVTHSVNQNVPNAALTALAFDTETEDRWGMHDPAANTRITIVLAGRYLIGCNCIFAAAGIPIDTQLQLWLNGVTSVGEQSQIQGGAGNSRLSLCRSIRLIEGDFIEVRAYQNSGGGLNMLAVVDSTPIFWAQWHSR